MRFFTVPTAQAARKSVIWAMGIIGGFQYFTQAYILLPRGGPEDSGLFYTIYLFQRAWKYMDMGYASAMAWVLFLVIVVLTGLVFKTRDRWVHYEA